MNEERTGGRFWLGFALGGAVGALLALIFTTDKGEEIREKIAQEGEEWIDQAAEKLEEIIEDLEKQTHEIKKDVGEKVSKKIENPLASMKALQAEITSSPRKRRFFKKGKKLA
jgi:gas vesicle protein